jgi:hypothetical protein
VRDYFDRSTAEDAGTGGMAPGEPGAVAAQAAGAGAGSGARAASTSKIPIAAKVSGVEIASDSITIGGNEVITTVTDHDSLASLPCSDGQIPKWSSALGGWQCGTDTLAGLVCVEGQVVRRIGGSWECDFDRVGGHQVVEGDLESCPGLSICQAIVDCPAGKDVFGGGLSAGTLNGLRMVYSWGGLNINTGNQSWHVGLRNNNVLSRSFTPMAVCGFAL